MTNSFKQTWLPLVVRLSVIGIVIILVWRWMVTDSGDDETPFGLLNSLGIFVLLCLVLARPLARLFSRPLDSLYFPSETLDEAPPMYGIAEARRKEGHPQAALDALQNIVREHPNDMRAYMEMMDIALLDLRQPDLALSMLHAGLSAMPDDGHREALKRVYDASLSRYTAVTKTAPPPLELRKSPSGQLDPPPNFPLAR